MKNYFSKLKTILKEQFVLYFILLIFSTLFIFKMALSAFFTQEDIIVDWVTFSLIALFMFSFIIQSLLLQKKCYPLFLFRVLVVIFLIFQVGWRHINFASYPKIFAQETGNSYDEQNDLLGFRLSPNLHNAQLCRIRQMMGNDTLCKVFYSSDSFCRRIPDDTFMEEYSVNQSHPDSHAVFLGCSFTFGDGLMYSSTFPYLFEKLNPDYKSYNYGVPGFGPHQIALLFDDQVNTINEEAIPEKKGFALYTYIDDHLNRVYGGSMYLRWAPFLSRNHDVYIENDSLKIKKRSQAQLKFADFLNQIALFKIFDVQFSYPKKEAFYKRFASIINYTAKKYWELKPDNHFYVSIYPGYGIDLNWVQYLDERIVVLKVDLPSDYGINRSKYELNKYNAHPSEEANAHYACEFTRLIEEYELQNKIN